MSKILQMPTTEPAPVESFFHDTGEGRIFCTLVGSLQQSGEVFVYFSPLFEERMWAHRIAFNFARELWDARHCAVLMFDYYGYGESDGNSEDFSLSRCARDVENLVFLLKERGASRFFWWGIRTGCAVAIACMGAAPNVSSAVFWAPIVDLNKYIRNSMRSTMAGQYMLFKKVVARSETILKELSEQGACVREGYTLNYIDGYRFGKALYEEIARGNGGPPCGLLTAPSLILYMEQIANNQRKAQIGDLFNENQVCSNVERRSIAERPFWTIGQDYFQRTNALYGATLEWLSGLK
jgi:hypothetical protein